MLPSSVRGPYALQGMTRRYDDGALRAVEQVSARWISYSGRA